MRIFLMGAAAIALAASGAIADPGKGNGGGNGHGNGGAKAAAGGPMAGGQGHGNKGPDRNGNAKQARADRGQPARLAQAKDDHGPSMRAQERKADRPVKSENRGNGNGNGNGNGKAKANSVRVVKDKARDVREVRPVRDVREVRMGNRDDNGPRIVRTVARFDPRGDHGLIDGCPPGLAKKHNGCMPPGLAKDRNDRYYYRSYNYRPSWFGYDRIGDGRYRYDDGYLYRVNDRGSILGYIPLLGGALSIGNPWPDYYQPVQVPDYYVDYYNLGAPGAYRYADDVLYRVDPQTDAITSIAALLTGDQFAVGQRMPAGYDVYNVPYAYRDRYYDTPQYDYRYADGYIYQVDPTTQLIAAAIQLLT